MTLTAPAGWEARVEAAPSSQGRAGGWRVHVRRVGDGAWLYLPNSIPAWVGQMRLKDDAERVVREHLKHAHGISMEER